MRIFFTFSLEFVELKIIGIRKRLIDFKKAEKQRKKKEKQEYKNFFEKRISSIFSIARFFIRVSNIDYVFLYLPDHILKYPEFWEFSSIILSVYSYGIEVSDELKIVLCLNLSVMNFSKEIFRLFTKFLKARVSRLFS